MSWRTDPTPHEQEVYDAGYKAGLASQRDALAREAMNIILDSDELLSATIAVSEELNIPSSMGVAKAAYEQADAMMAERAKHDNS